MSLKLFHRYREFGWVSESSAGTICGAMKASKKESKQTAVLFLNRARFMKTSLKNLLNWVSYQKMALVMLLMTSTFSKSEFWSMSCDGWLGKKMFNIFHRYVEILLPSGAFFPVDFIEANLQPGNFNLCTCNCFCIPYFWENEQFF